MDVKCERGQAIFEVLVFLPLFIFFLTIIFNVGNAINVSINQQKVTRRYFYYLAKGNSYLPVQPQLEATRNAGTIQILGFAFNGYRQESASGGANTSPVAPCFKFNSFLTGDSGETCEDPSSGSGDEGVTNFVRVYTGYGICGETFRRDPALNLWAPLYTIDGVRDPRSQRSGCVIQ